MNKVKHAEKPVNNEPRYKRVAALMIMICMAVIPWIIYEGGKAGFNGIRIFSEFRWSVC